MHVAPDGSSLGRYYVESLRAIMFHSVPENCLGNYFRWLQLFHERDFLNTLHVVGHLFRCLIFELSILHGDNYCVICSLTRSGMCFFKRFILNFCLNGCVASFSPF
jgi:hypothetical protein